MPILSTSIRQYGNKPTEIPETYTEPRYCLSIEFAPGQTIYIPSHNDILPSSVVKEDAEDGATNRWTIYDATPAGAAVSNVFDATRNSNVIEFTVSGAGNGFRIGSAVAGGGGSWGYVDGTTVSWRMKTAGPTIDVFIHCGSTAGDRVITYEELATNRGNLFDEYFYFGLGSTSVSDNWVKFTRDLQTDIEIFEPGNTITAIYGISIRPVSTLRIDDITLLSTDSMLPPGASYTKARLAAGPMPNINRNAGFISGKSAISTPTYEVVDVDNELTDLIADKNINGIGTLNAKITEWEFSPDTVDFWTRMPKFTGLIQNHSKPFNTIQFETADINRGLDIEIFDPLKWKFNGEITELSTAIPTTLPVSDIAENNRLLLRAPGDLAQPLLTGGYIQMSTTEIIWHEGLVDVGGIATFSNCKRGQLGTVAKGILASAVGTKEESLPDITEWIVIEERALELIKGLISGQFEGGRVLPPGWSAHQGDEWIEHVSFASHASEFRLIFQNPGKVKCRDFLEKEILPVMNAVLTVDGWGRLNYTPRVMPIDESSGEIMLDPSNCVTTNQMTLKHVKDDIYPSVRINFDWNAITEEFLSLVTYRDEESALHNKVDVTKTKEYSFKGLHAGLHTGSQLRKLAATYGDDHFYEVVEFTVESFLNNIPLGSLVNTDFENVRDDTVSTGVDSPLNRTMLVVSANENRSSRTTTYNMIGSLYVQSIRQASQAQNNIEFEEYKRDKIDIASLNVNISNGIATGGPMTLEMGKKYYYVDEANLGIGLELSESLTVNIVGTGTNIELWIFGPFYNKTTLDLTGKSNHVGGIGGTSGSRPQSGNQGYCLNTTSASALRIEQLYNSYRSNDEDVYTKIGVQAVMNSLGKITRGKYSRAPEPLLSSNNGVVTGIPADLGGTGGSGGDVSIFYDEDLRPQSPGGPTNSVPATNWINGGAGGRGGGGLCIVSWGGGVVGNGEIILSGGNPATENSSQITANVLMKGARGCGGGPGSLLWIVDGNHAAPFLTDQTLKAYYGNASVAGTPIGDLKTIYSSEPADTYKGKYDARSWTFNHAEAVARIVSLPPPEEVKAKQLSEIAEFFSNQRDGKVKLIVQDTEPSNGNIGDAWITYDQLNSNSATPIFSILVGGIWRPFNWETDAYAGLYGGLISMYRSYGTDVWLTSDTRPSAFEDGWAWTNSLTGETWILYNDGNDILVQVGDSPVGTNHYRDGNFSLQQEAIARDIAGPWNIVDTFDIPALVEGGTATPTPGAGTAPPPQSVSVYFYSPTQSEIIIGAPPDESLVVSYNIYRNNSFLANVVKPVHSYLDNGIVASTAYTYEVTSVDGASDESVRVGTSPPTLNSPSVPGPTAVINSVIASGGFVNGTTGGGVYQLDPPTNLSVLFSSPTSGELSWTPPGDTGVGIGYEIRRNNILMTTHQPASATQYFFDDMQPNTFYTWDVRLVGGGQRSADASTNDTSPGGVTFDLDVPTWRNGTTSNGVSIASSTAAEIFWNPPGDTGVGTGYEIYQNSVFRTYLAGPTTDSHWMDTNLSAGLSYTWWVRLVNNAGSERSDDLILTGTMNA